MTPNIPIDITHQTSRSECPEIEILEHFVSGQLPENVDLQIERHVEQCQSCQSYLEYKSKQERHLFEINSGVARQMTASIYSKPEIKGFDIIDYYKSGGQGVVFKARDQVLNRQVAVKVLKDYHSQDTDRESSILVEARAIAKLSHPNIVKLHNLAWTAQGPAMIMDWIEGENLLEKLKTTKCTQVEAVEILIHLCEAVAVAHSAGILHRDIKPSNILLNHNSFKEPMLCDFGLVKFQQDNGDFSTATLGIGTAGFMPPEMISKRFGKISASSDIYSIGAVLYHLLTGRLPHESLSAFETMESTCEKDVMPPTFFEKEIHRDLETICLKCMQREPNLRYKSVLSLKNDLEKFLKKQPVNARRSTSIQRLRIWRREHPWIAFLTFSLFCVLTTSVILLSYALNRALEGERRTEKELARTTEIFRISAPLVKRFLQFGILKQDEIVKIQKLSKLLEEIGTDSSNLRQRFDLIYVGLELANGLRNDKDQKELSLEMTRQSRIALRKLIDENGPELDQQPFLMHEGKIAISLLDQSLIRYGHSCMQLGSLLQSRDQVSGWRDSEPYVDEAIRTAEAVTRKNPEVDEAFTDLANYYFDKYKILEHNGEMHSVAEIPQKVDSIHARMMKLYPDAPEKINYWLISNQLLLDSMIGNDANSLLFDQTIGRVNTEMKRIRARNDILWPLTAESFVYTLLVEPREFYRKEQWKRVTDVMKPLMDACQEMVASKVPLAQNIKLYLNVGLEQIAVLQTEPSTQKAALALFHEMERYFKLPSNESLNPMSLAELYLRSPIPEARSNEKAMMLLKALDSKISGVDHLKNLCNVAMDPSFEMAKTDSSNISEIQIRRDIIKAESLLKHGRQKEATAIVRNGPDLFKKYHMIPIDYQLRLKLIHSQLQSLK